MPAEECLPIEGEEGIVLARSRARAVARELGFSMVDQSRIATAVSELTRNVVRYATGGRGEVTIRAIPPAERGRGIEIVVADEGPGIADVEEALREGTSSARGLGMGLPGTQRLMDDMVIETAAGQGTCITHPQVAFEVSATIHRPISSQSDVEQVRREARRAAAALGFDRGDAESIALAVSELATNLVRYAWGGVVRIAVLGQPVAGIEIECTDQGPGIADIDVARRDGTSTSGGLGGGLGAVGRLMDDVDIGSGPEGTRIVARKWLPGRR